MAPKKHEFEHDVKLDVEARVHQGVKAVLEEVPQDEMAQHLKAGYRELTPTRRGERNGYYTRNLVTPAGKIEHLEVPRECGVCKSVQPPATRDVSLVMKGQRFESAHRLSIFACKLVNNEKPRQPRKPATPTTQNWSRNACAP